MTWYLRILVRPPKPVNAVRWPAAAEPAIMPDMCRTPPGPAWDSHALRNPHGQPDKAVRVEAMFDAIAPTYERVNTVATFGRDAAWRRLTVAAADVRPADAVLDICCGTGDMLRAFAVHTPRPRLLLGIDFSAGMLAAARFNGMPVPIRLIRADALHLPLVDASVDVITCAFGVRNFGDLAAGLREMHRVARPGARVLILEFATPKNGLLRWAHQLYCDRVLPALAAIISRDRTGAYRYLPRSIRTFESTRVMAGRIADAGFHAVAVRRMNFGGVVLYRGVKPGPVNLVHERADG